MLNVSTTASLMTEVRQLLGADPAALGGVGQSSATSSFASSQPGGYQNYQQRAAQGASSSVPSAFALAPASDLDPLMSIHAKHPPATNTTTHIPAHTAEPLHHRQTAAFPQQPARQHAPSNRGGASSSLLRLGMGAPDDGEDLLDALARPAAPLDPADSRAFAEERRRVERVPTLDAHREVVAEEVAEARAEARAEVGAALQAFHSAALELAVLRERAQLIDVARDAEIAQLEAALELAAAEQGLRRERCNELDAKLRGLAEKKINILARHLDRVHAEARADSGLSDAASSRSGGAASGPNRVTASRAGSQRGGGHHGAGSDQASHRAGSPPASQRGGGGGSGGGGGDASGRRGGADDSQRSQHQQQQQQLRGMSPGKRAWAKVKNRLLGAALTSVSQKRGNTATALRGSSGVMVIGEDGVPTNAPSFVCGPLTKAAVDGYFAGRRSHAPLVAEVPL